MEANSVICHLMITNGRRTFSFLLHVPDFSHITLIYNHDIWISFLRSLLRAHVIKGKIMAPVARVNDGCELPSYIHAIQGLTLLILYNLIKMFEVIFILHRKQDQNAKGNFRGNRITTSS